MVDIIMSMDLIEVALLACTINPIGVIVITVREKYMDWRE